jgi:hypothetical protein
VAATTTATELGYVNGVTSALQTQLGAKLGAVTDTTTVNLTITGGVTLSADVERAAAATGWVWLSNQGASSSVTIDFTGLSVYQRYKITVEGLYPATDSVLFQLRADSDNGASFDTGVNYAWNLSSNSSTPAVRTNGATGTTSLYLIGDTAGWNLGNATSTERFSGEVEITYLGDGAAFAQIRWEFVGAGDTNLATTHRGSGYWGSAVVLNAVRFFCSSGNIAGGNFNLYGLKRS